jgi:hypothetical protein
VQGLVVSFPRDLHDSSPRRSYVRNSGHGERLTKGQSPMPGGVVSGSSCGCEIEAWRL